MIFLWLALLSIFTYLAIQKSVSNITQTPVWLLWSVMMLPLLLLIVLAVVGDRLPIPSLPLLAGSFMLCSLAYWMLIWAGRRSQPSSPPSTSNPPGHTSDDTPLTSTSLVSEMTLPANDNTMDRDDEDALKRCFPWSVYYLKGIERRPHVLICTGHLRTSSDIAYQTIRDNIEKQFGQRFLIIFQEGLNGKPFFALVPNSQISQLNQQQNHFHPMIALGLFLSTVCTTVLAGILLSGGSPDDILPFDPSVIVKGIPYCFAITLILAVYHFSQYVIAKRNQIKVSLPYFIPVPPVLLGFPFGTFGAFLQVRSPMPNRKVLFDMGFIGPIAGTLITAPILLWGLHHSTLIASPEQSGLFNITSFDPKASFLIALLSKLALPTLTLDAALKLHPVAIAGCLGMLIITLNLMPVGQLNGGKIVHAMFGQRTGALIGQVARVLVLLLAYVHRDQQEFWILPILLFFMPSVDEPALNDVSELDNQRDFLGLAALALLIIIILPAPPALTHLLFG